MVRLPGIPRVGRALAALALLAGIAGPACRQTPAQRLVREFSGAYPPEAHPTGQVRSFEIVAAETELPLLDGNRLRVWAYNGQVPGPTLRVRLGDTVRVHFVNRLPQPTTIHWHGVRVPNAMDGVPNLTQPQVEPGQAVQERRRPPDRRHDADDGEDEQGLGHDHLERGPAGPLDVTVALPQPVHVRDREPDPARAEPLVGDQNPLMQRIKDSNCR